jgi:DNA-binding NarL/FixJ family response regulator
MNPFRILLADEHPIFLLGLRSVLASHEGWEVCAEAADGQDAIEKCMHLKPDLIILDICIPKLNGLDGVRQILKYNPEQRILILTDSDSEKMVRLCLQAGVCGWILRSDGILDLTQAVQAVREPHETLGLRTSPTLVGGRWKATPAPTKAQSPHLSPREREVLQLVAEGKKCKEVAVILDISVRTADTHRSNLMSKLNLHSVAQLVVYAVRNEVIRVQVPTRDHSKCQDAGQIGVSPAEIFGA